MLAAPRLWPQCSASGAPRAHLKIAALTRIAGAIFMAASRGAPRGSLLGKEWSQGRGAIIFPSSSGLVRMTGDVFGVRIPHMPLLWLIVATDSALKGIMLGSILPPCFSPWGREYGAIEGDATRRCQISCRSGVSRP